MVGGREEGERSRRRDVLGRCRRLERRVEREPAPGRREGRGAETPRRRGERRRAYFDQRRERERWCPVLFTI